MFIRKKKNKSGSISVQVVDKSTGKYRVLQTIGSSSNPRTIESLIIKGKRLEKLLNKGKLTKANINNRGYNKYLKMEGDVKISIDKEKFEDDAKWDGLKGYITNSNLSKNEIIENYGHLWKIEKAFRISKHDLKIRPIYHRLQRRIESHITINFAAYKVYKELERQLKEKKSHLSAEMVIEIAKTIYSITIQNPITKFTEERTLILNDEQEYIANLFEF